MQDRLRCWGVADDGTTIGLVLPSEFSHVLAQHWPPIGLRRSAKPAKGVVRQLTVNGIEHDGDLVIIVDGTESPGGWERVESELSLFAAERLNNLVAVHAAVILRGDAALVVPGPSHAGKSSLCMAAAAVGAAVLSDEYALVDPVTGRVSGWPRPIRVRRPDGGVDREDIAVVSDPVRVGLVAMVHYEAGTDDVWRPVPAADTVLGLLANTVCAQSRPDEALDAACAVARSSPAVAGPRGEAILAVEELLTLMATLAT